MSSEYDARVRTHNDMTRSHEVRDILIALALLVGAGVITTLTVHVIDRGEWSEHPFSVCAFQLLIFGACGAALATLRPRGQRGVTALERVAVVAVISLLLFALRPELSGVATRFNVIAYLIIGNSLIGNCLFGCEIVARYARRSK